MCKRATTDNFWNKDSGENFCAFTTSNSFSPVLPVNITSFWSYNDLTGSLWSEFWKTNLGVAVGFLIIWVWPAWSIKNWWCVTIPWRLVYVNDANHTKTPSVSFSVVRMKILRNLRRLEKIIPPTPSMNFPVVRVPFLDRTTTTRLYIAAVYGVARCSKISLLFGHVANHTRMYPMYWYKAILIGH